MLKMFKYSQSTGFFDILRGEQSLRFGQFPSGSNDPADNCVRGIGPVPRGRYRLAVEDEHARFAGPVIRFYPEDKEGQCGRSAFLIHGGTRSEGCILIQAAERRAVAALVRAGYATLIVE